jgi:hypothetical protein
MAAPHPFRLAAEAKDLEAMTATLREDVVLQVLTHVVATLEDFRYTDELAEGRTVALRFKARVGDRELEGIDFLELDDDGLVAELTVFMRPMSALTAFNERMAARLGVDRD